MRILILNYEFPPIGGGGGRVSAELAREFVVQGHTVHVITSAYDVLPHYSEADGCTIQRVPVMRRNRDRCSIPEMLAYIVLSFIPTLRAARHFKPDIIHAHFGIPTGVLALAARLLLGYPFVLTIHAGDVPGFMPDEVGLHHRLITPFTRLIWHRSAQVIGVSAGIRCMALQTAPHLAVEVIPNGIRSSDPPQIKRDYQRPLQLMFVGRIVRQKGVEYLIEALAEIANADWRLTIVGDGPRRPEIERLIQKHQLDQQINITGWIDHAEVEALYQRLDIFVLPSVIEGMPVVVLEAMRFGMSIIGTDVNGTQDLIESGRNGWLVPPQQVVELANAIQDALTLSPNDLEAMGSASQQIVYRDFTWDNLAAQYVQVFKAIIELKRPA